MAKEAGRKAVFVDGRHKAAAYQNKDITSKVLAENLKGKIFRTYGLELPEIKDVRPTNIPAVRANELRLGSLFELANNTVALVDYESRYRKADKVKYLNCLAKVASRCQKKKDCPKLQMVVIYTGDISRNQVNRAYNAGAVKIQTETAFLSELDGEGMLKRLEGKVRRNEALTDEELMELIILPLSYRKKEEKRIHDAVGLAVKIQDREQQVFALAGILAFTDKVIDRETADKIKSAIEMTQVAMIFEEEKQQAVKQAVVAERKKAADGIKAERKKAAYRRKQYGTRHKLDRIPKAPAAGFYCHQAGHRLFPQLFFKVHILFSQSPVSFTASLTGIPTTRRMTAASLFAKVTGKNSCRNPAAC